MSCVRIFNWPDVRIVLPHRTWHFLPGSNPQHRYWMTADGWMSCIQDYSQEDYHRVMGLAGAFGAAEHIINFKVSVEDSGAVATFYGIEDAEPIRRVFLCTAGEVMVITMEFVQAWNSETQAMLDTYVRACEVEANLFQ